MILEDRRLLFHYQEHPQFLLRLDTLLTRMRAPEKPSLVAQLMPRTPLSLDTDNKSLVALLRGGAGTSDSWWNGFQSYEEYSPTMYGVATSPTSDKLSWTFEVHRDGHFIAAIWNFPVPDDSEATQAMPDYYAFFIHDVFSFAGSILNHYGYSQADFLATATVISANILPFMRHHQFMRRYVTDKEALPVKNLPLPIVEAKCGADSWNDAKIMLGKNLCGAYGCAAPSKR